MHSIYGSFGSEVLVNGRRGSFRDPSDYTADAGSEHIGELCDSLRESFMCKDAGIPYRRDNGYQQLLFENALAANTSIASSTKLVPDSGATCHCFNQRSLFSSITLEDPGINVRVANNTIVRAEAIGTVPLLLRNANGKLFRYELQNVLLLPCFGSNLVSIRKLFDDHGITTVFGSRAFFETRDNDVLYLDDARDGMHFSAHSAIHGVPSSLYHKRFGHIGERRMLRALRNAELPHVNEPKSKCPACEESGKQRRKPRPYRRAIRNIKPLFGYKKQYTYFGEMVYSDLMGPMPASAIHKFTYAICFVDAATGFAFTVALKNKLAANVLAAFQLFLSLHREYLRDGRVSEWHCDNGGEFTSTNLHDFCIEIATRRSWSVPYVSNTNAKAERFWGCILRPMRSMFADSKVPFSLWPYCMEHATLLHNVMPSSSLERNMSPFELVYDRKYDISLFRVFGCTVYYKVPARQLANRFSRRSVPAVHLGMDSSRSGYKVFVPCLKRFTTVPKQARFDESTMCSPDGSFVGCHEDYSSDRSVGPSSSSVPNDVSDEPSPVRRPAVTPVPNVPISVDPEPNSDGIQPIRDVSQRPTRTLPNRTRGQPDRFIPGKANTVLSENHISCSRQWVNIIDALGSQMVFAIDISRVQAPANYRSAKSSTLWFQWSASMDNEMAGLLKHDTWELVSRSSLPRNRKPTKSKWVYVIKHARDGTIEKFKSRFVVCGYSQIEGLDFDQAFSSTLRSTSLRTLLALAAQHGLQLDHVDVSNAFTQALIDEDIWVEPPKGYEVRDADGTTKVLKLRKALYGCRQSGRLWQDTLRQWLLEYGFTSSVHDPCIYILRRNGAVLLIGVFVDDLVCAHNNASGVFKSFLACFMERFNSKHLGLLSWYLGMAVDQSAAEISIHQGKYIMDMVSKYIEGPVSERILRDTPCVPEKFRQLNRAADDAERDFMRDKDYLGLVGSLLYLSTTCMSRPDISYHMSVLCKFMSDPSRDCHDAAMGVLLYVYKTRERRIRYTIGSKTPACLHQFNREINGNYGFHSFSDSSWGVPNPVFGYCLWLSNGPISWCAKTCKSADSSCEAEYTAASKALRDVKFVRYLCEDMGYPLTGRLVNAVDNTAAIDTASNRGVTARNKHYEREIHWIRSEVEFDRAVLAFVPTLEQRADLFTKALDKTALYRHLDAFVR